MLGQHKDHKGIKGEKTWIYFQESELNWVVNNFHSVMVVYGMFVLPVEVQKQEEDNWHDERNLKCEKYRKWIYFEQNN